MLNPARIPPDVLALLESKETIPAAPFENCRLPGEARAGLLLHLGLGEESHKVSQDLTTREGSYWHGIYHRMEPDDFNAKYWFSRVGPHEIGPELRDAALAAGWDPGRNWDHARFVDFMSSARAGGPSLAIAEKIQLAEWELLFEFCAAKKNI